MKTFEVTFILTASDDTTEQDVNKAISDNTSCIEVDLEDCDISDIYVNEFYES